MSEQPVSDCAVEFRGVTKSFINKQNEIVRALEDVTFTVRRGEFLAIIGPSGCGKSTTLNVIAGLTSATSGKVMVSGKPVGETRIDLGYVFQQDSVLPWKKVIDNIQIGLRLRNIPKRQSKAKAIEFLHLMGLTDFANAYPVELSGGMRKRVALAASLAYDPAVLLMDEPFGALDAQTRIVLQDEMLRLWAEKRPTVLFVTHDIGEAIAMADRVIVMTARPARIKVDCAIDLPRPRSAAEIRFDPNFERIHQRIWNELKPEITAQGRIGGRE